MEGESAYIYQEFFDDAAAPTQDVLPPKSKTRYEREYEDFLKWRKNECIETVNEDVLMTYLLILSKSFAPNSLWTKVSMLKTCIKLHENIDISGYGKVFSFLKRKSKSYKPKKSKVLTAEQITTYFMEAPNEDFLLDKVILLFGIYGACRREELVTLSVDNIEDTGKFIIVTLQDKQNKSSRKFIITEDDTPFKGCELYRQYVNLRPSDLQTSRFFVDYRRGKCTRQYVGVHKIGGIPKKIAEFLKLENPEQYTGHCFRRSSATMLANNGGDLTLKQFVGWRSAVVAEQYVEESEPENSEDYSEVFKDVKIEDSSMDYSVEPETMENMPEFVNMPVPGSSEIMAIEPKLERFSPVETMFETNPAEMALEPLSRRRIENTTNPSSGEDSEIPPAETVKEISAAPSLSDISRQSNDRPKRACSFGKEPIYSYQRLKSSKTAETKKDKPSETTSKTENTKSSSTKATMKTVNTAPEKQERADVPHQGADEYDFFGRTVASHLRQLPMSTSLECQTAILDFLVQTRLGRTVSFSPLLERMRESPFSEPSQVRSTNMTPRRRESSLVEPSSPRPSSVSSRQGAAFVEPAPVYVSDNNSEADQEGPSTQVGSNEECLIVEEVAQMARMIVPGPLEGLVQEALKRIKGPSGDEQKEGEIDKAEGNGAEIVEVKTEIEDDNAPDPVSMLSVSLENVKQEIDEGDTPIENSDPTIQATLPQSKRPLDNEEDSITQTTEKPTETPTDPKVKRRRPNDPHGLESFDLPANPTILGLLKSINLNLGRIAKATELMAHVMTEKKNK